MKIQLVGVLSILVVVSGQAYERYKMKPSERTVKQPEDPQQKQMAPTYYTDDGQYAVYLTLEERRIIERILKPSIIISAISG